MAPEQAMGEADIDHRVDIYAVGCLAYEMLTGQSPFEGRTPQAVLAAHVMEAPKDPRELRSASRAPLAEAVMRCLAKPPAERWQTADGLRVHLESMQATPSGGMTPTDTKPYQATTARTKSGPRRLWAAVATAAVVITGGAGAWFALQGSSEGISRLGVLPVQDISGQDPLFVTAMHDALTNALAQLGVGVASRSEMAGYAGGDKSTREIATERDLDAVVETTVFRAGDVMRITVQLSDPVTTRALWADSYTSNVSDVLAAQDAVVDSVRIGIGTALQRGNESGGNE
jgi:serine/threonine-protein kinase